MNRPAIRSAIRVLRKWDAALIRGTSAVQFDMRLLMNRCGTVGCAAGYLGSSRAMHKRGLGFRHGCFIFNGNGMLDHHSAFISVFELEYSEGELTYLAFSGSNPYTRPGQVADILQGFLNGGIPQAKVVQARIVKTLRLRNMEASDATHS